MHCVHGELAPMGRTIITAVTSARIVPILIRMVSSSLALNSFRAYERCLCLPLIISHAPRRDRSHIEDVKIG